MIAILLLCLADEVRASLVADRPRAEIGEPVVLSLVVERPASVAVTVPEIEAGVRGSWLFLEALGTRRDTPRGAPGPVVETTRWRAFALEGGAALPPVAVSYTADAGPQTLAATPGAIEVPSALGEGEDAPRPTKGFRDPVAWSGGGSRLTLAGLAVASLLAAAVAWWIVRRRRRRAEPLPTTDAAAELARLAGVPRDDSAANRALLFDVTRIVRAAIDAHVGEARAARTDAEWLAILVADERVPEGARAASRRLLERAERVKYAGETPTRFAADEALADARAIVAALEPERRAA